MLPRLWPMRCLDSAKSVRMRLEGEGEVAEEGSGGREALGLWRESGGDELL